MVLTVFAREEKRRWMEEGVGVEKGGGGGRLMVLEGDEELLQYAVIYSPHGERAGSTVSE
jgi:hypothetical protein